MDSTQVFCRTCMLIFIAAIANGVILVLNLIKVKKLGVLLFTPL